MKVTVDFRGTKIVVPCGDGRITVRELTALSGTRYKKAMTAKYRHGEHWLSVSCLRSHEGGILDPDDLICAVCDDREQLEAVFSEQAPASAHPGDGQSQTQFPEQVQYDEAGFPMQIRRGSEPSLNKSPHRHHPIQATYRQFASNNPGVPLAANVGADDRTLFAPPAPYSSSSSSTLVPATAQEGDSETYDSLPDSAAFDSKCSLSVGRRREPLGASAGNNNKQEKGKGSGGNEQRQQLSLAPNDAGCQRQQMVRPSVEIIIPNEIGPLGIHVVPSKEDEPGPLIVQGIEPGGRVDRDGRLAVGDEIMEINGYSLSSVSFAKAQEVFKEALSAKELKLRVVKGISDVVAASAVSVAAAAAALENKENREMGADSPVVGCKVTAAVQANNTRKIGRVIRIALTKGASGLGFSITTRDNAPGGPTPVYIKNIMAKGAAIDEGTLRSGDRLLEVDGTPVDGMSQSEVVDLLKKVQVNATVELAVSRHSVGASGETDSATGTLKRVQIKEEPKDKVDAVTEPMEQGEVASAKMDMDQGGEESSGSGSMNFPWRQREILTFDIPVHDSELAGLGVSVKGKTSTNADGGVVDLGIFVKSVLHGGAASRDGRLKTNDQLVNINGASLLGKPNPQAMETLRKAMHEEGPTPGIISLTVARQASLLPLDKKSFSREDGARESFSSQVTSSSDDHVREYSVSAPVFKSPPKKAHLHSQGLVAGRNPVIDRLMGKDAAAAVGLVPANMRNESYYMATHDTWNATMATGQQQLPMMRLESPTVHQTGKAETVMIEQDSSTVGADSASSHTVDATRGSMASLSETYQAFARDQPGRQSMSEKRHATLDAKATDTYQKRKKARDDRLKLQQQEHRALRWKKSASVESLHLIGAAESRKKSKGQSGHGQQLEYLTPEEREALKTQYVRASSVRVSRSRGCNESFRQAVDRSYEGGDDGGDDFEIEDEDDAEVADVVAGGAVLRERGGGRDLASSASAKKKNRNSKLLRNFGAMFRFGSGGRGDSKHHPHRKSQPNTPTPNNASGVPRPSTTSLPLSQSVPDYQLYDKSRSGAELPSSTSATDFVRPYQQQQQHQQYQQRAFQYEPQQASTVMLQQQHRYVQQQQQQPTYDYLPSAMMRPGSRVGIADPGANTAASDYEVIQRHLHCTRVPYHSPPRQQQQQQQQYYQPQQRVPHRQPRSHSNPSRARPKSNFYEYDFVAPGVGGSGDLPHVFGAGGNGGFGRGAPPVPQKPSERAVQQHLSNIAATDPNLYGATTAAYQANDPYGYAWQQQQQQQQQRPRATSSMEHQINPQYSVRGGQQHQQQNTLY